MNKEKIIILSHCILNDKSKVKKIEKDPNPDVLSFIQLLIENDIGIVQMPCPELICYGLNRWGHVKEQYDHPHYRKMCRKLFLPILDQIIEYSANNYEVVALVGIYGSPTCGIYRTCSGKWGGELGSNPDIKSTISTVTGIEESGVFMEEIQKILEENNIELKMIDFNKEDMNETIEKIKELI
ncbi:hypothetical protein KQI42_12395 [Tissierella sp. MSJ-40]|uniref:DUF523 domain-containing protein n=1 Tax=Tissierella simiarum TaxID=2841534 RepID=A0ABS6E9D3_9FIRM|nr:CD3072 family TudS-related putative desulfidase [Tissierella simiarum]MBU5438819.1 hypothetical protein [Tissierella simiarum]